MHFKVRVLDKQTFRDILVNLPRNATIQELQECLQKEHEIDMESQCLYFRGKQLLPYLTLIDCKVNYNDIVQLNVKPEEKEEEILEPPVHVEQILVEAKSRHFKVADLVEVCDREFGAWWDAKIVGIFKDENNQSKDLIFRIHYEWNDPSVTCDFKLEEVRPRSKYVYQKKDLKAGMLVLANHNLEEPNKRGYWYNFKIDKINNRFILGTLYVGVLQQPVQRKKIRFTRELMKIEKTKLWSENSKSNTSKIRKKLPFYCDSCRDRGDICFNCGCYHCGEKKDEDKTILCDECGDGYHLYCLNPALDEVPSESEWFCPDCKNPDITIATFESKNRSRPSISSRGHSHGMTCVGRTSICTVVPVNHFGPIPGIEVGTCWKFRIQLSEAGVHRPIMAGIHGNSKEGAYSLVLSGGYEDDEDNGDEFFYTGSGGRNSSSIKRTGKQCADQKLTLANKALAINCNANINEKHGAKAKNWQGGKPVRVIRNYKGSSKFSPKDGNRYDGIYKVVKYFPKVGKAGYRVWTFILRRDDPSPAPWDQGGQELPIIYPLGYLESQNSSKVSMKRKRKFHDGHTSSKRASKARKRKSSEDDDCRRMKTYKEKYFGGSPRKPPRQEQKFCLTSEVQRYIKADTPNVTLWDDCLKFLDVGKNEFMQRVRESFICICCQELLYQPITTPCNHNVCRGCLINSFKAEIYNCPYCRLYVSHKKKLNVNKNLQKVLSFLFEGYDEYREDA